LEEEAEDVVEEDYGYVIDSDDENSDEEDEDDEDLGGEDGRNHGRWTTSKQKASMTCR